MKKIVSFLFVLILLSCKTEQREESINLIPDAPSPTPSYWCTWGAQNYASDSTTLKNAVWGVNQRSTAEFTGQLLRQYEKVLVFACGFFEGLKSFLQLVLHWFKG